jgi:MFS family permease
LVSEQSVLGNQWSQQCRLMLSQGNVLGSFLAGPLVDDLGRLRGMAIANVVVVIGTAIQAAAFKRRDMIVGRIVLGVGSVMLGPSAQAYTVEISHPAYRGVMMGIPGQDFAVRRA